MARLKSTGLYKPRSGRGSVKYQRRLLRPGTTTGEVAGRRAEVVSVSSSRQAKEKFGASFVTKGRKVVVPRTRPGSKIYSRKGEIFERTPEGERLRKVAPAADLGLPGPERPPRGEIFVIRIYGHPSGMTAATRSQAERIIRLNYPKIRRDGQPDPLGAPPVSVETMRPSEFDRIMEESQAAQAAARTRRHRSREEIQSGFRRGVRPRR